MASSSSSIQGHCFHTRYSCSTKISILGPKKANFRSHIIHFEKVDSVELEKDLKGPKERKLRILVAGGGIGGLVLGLAAKNRGFEVKVFEKNLSAVRGEGWHRGPIQLQSNALAVLEAIDEKVAEKIIEAGCTTGNRINGLADGITGHWFAKFDLLTPAIRRGFPPTLVICRMMLQNILVNAVGPDVVYNKSNVVDFEEDSSTVTVMLEDGRQFKGDILVGADGIWSKVRTKLFGWQEAQYSNYTCYSGLVDFAPPYISTIGYRVFLGFNQYFVASDVGDGKMQWYAFHKEPPGNSDPPSGKKQRLLELFGNWCSDVVNILSETPESMILRRDIYDRDMIYSWGQGRVMLLGDSAHAMQPNLGQGGCMAIEDCYQLIFELERAVGTSSHDTMTDEIAFALKRYEQRRKIRVSVVHAVSRMASKMVCSYRPYLDFGSGPLSVVLADVGAVPNRASDPTSRFFSSTCICPICNAKFDGLAVSRPWVVTREEIGDAATEMGHE